MTEKPYNFEKRLIRFAGEVIYYCKTLPNDKVSKYYGDQILRSSRNVALNYGEAQGTTTIKDFIHKMSIVLKELKETLVALKILGYVNYADAKRRDFLKKEAEELGKW